MAGLDSYTTMLLHMDGADGSTTFTDSSTYAQTVTAYIAEIDTAQSKFGGASGLFNFTQAQLTVNDDDDIEFGSGDWTIDFWIRFAAVNVLQVLWQNGYNTGDKRSVAIYFNADGVNSTLQVAQSTTGGDSVDVGRSFVPSVDTWYHIAVVRSSSVVKIFIDGTQSGTDMTAYNLHNPIIDKYVGANDGAGNYPVKGWLDEFRISKGIARWTANFTPPTEAYSAGVPQNIRMIA